MPFRNKVFFGYLLMALVFTGGILLCLKTLGPIERSFERLSAENLPVLNLIQDIRTQGSMLHGQLIELSALLSLDVTPESSLALLLERAEIDDTQIQLQSVMQDYRDLIEMYFPEESSYIPLMQTQIDQMILMSKELSAQASCQPGSFSLAMKNRFEDLEESFLAVTNEIISYEVREVQVRREHINIAVAKARFLIGTIIFVSFALALILTLLMTRLRSNSEPSGERGRRLSFVSRRDNQRE
jgi:hypothetical protein